MLRRAQTLERQKQEMHLAIKLPSQMRGEHAGWKLTLEIVTVRLAVTRTVWRLKSGAPR